MAGGNVYATGDTTNGTVGSVTQNPYVRMALGPLGQGLFPEAAPQLQQAGISQPTSDLIDQGVAQANLTNQDYANLTAANTGNYGGLIGDQTQRQMALGALGGPADNGMGQAIADRSKRFYDAQLSGVNRQATFGAPLLKANQMASIQSGLMGQQGVTNNVAALQTAAQQRYQQQRNAALNQTLGGVGAIGGSIYAKSRQNGQQPAAPTPAPAPIQPNYGDFNSNLDTSGYA